MYSLVGRLGLLVASCFIISVFAAPAHHGASPLTDGHNDPTMVTPVACAIPRRPPAAHIRPGLYSHPYRATTHRKSVFQDKSVMDHAFHVPSFATGIDEEEDDEDEDDWVTEYFPGNELDKGSDEPSSYHAQQDLSDAGESYGETARIFGSKMMTGAGQKLWNAGETASSVMSSARGWFRGKKDPAITAYAAPFRAAARERYIRRKMVSENRLLSHTDHASSSSTDTYVHFRYDPITFTQYVLDLVENELGDPIHGMSLKTAEYLKDLVFYQLNRLSTEEIIRRFDDPRYRFWSIGFGEKLPEEFYLAPLSGIGSIFTAVGESEDGFQMFHQRLPEGSPQTIEYAWGAVAKKAIRTHVRARKRYDGTWYDEHPEDLALIWERHEELDRARRARGDPAQNTKDDFDVALQTLGFQHHLNNGKKVTRDMLKDAYREAALRSHPDKNHDDHFPRLFIAKRAAYQKAKEYLENEEQKKASRYFGVLR